MKKLTTGLNKEIDQCKEMIWTKDKALEDAQKSYTRTAKELNRVRSEYGELETLLTRLKVDMQSTASNQSKDRTRIQELSEEVRSVASGKSALSYVQNCFKRFEPALFAPNCGLEHSTSRPCTLLEEEVKTKAQLLHS